MWGLERPLPMGWPSEALLPGGALFDGNFGLNLVNLVGSGRASQNTELFGFGILVSYARTLF